MRKYQKVLNRLSELSIGVNPRAASDRYILMTYQLGERFSGFSSVRSAKKEWCEKWFPASLTVTPHTATVRGIRKAEFVLAPFIRGEVEIPQAYYRSLEHPKGDSAAFKRFRFRLLALLIGCPEEILHDHHLRRFELTIDQQRQDVVAWAKFFCGRAALSKYVYRRDLGATRHLARTTNRKRLAPFHGSNLNRVLGYLDDILRERWRQERANKRQLCRHYKKLQIEREVRREQSSRAL